MDRYYCKDCGKTFRYYGVNVSSDSSLVNILTSYCPKCGSFNLDLTEHGKLLMERKRKLERLDQLNKN